MNLNSKKIIIGDVHGKIDQYRKILKKHKSFSSIQVGDFGFQKEHDWHMKNINGNQHKINFGNHDYYPYLFEKHSLENYSLINNEIMTIRGAFSIDKVYRTEGLDWFANEELNYGDMQAAIDFYEINKPRIVISHDCPHNIRNLLFGIEAKSITTNGLQIMLEIHKPDLWIFGHHHISVNEMIGGTRFRCLAELETMEL
jgi:predicted phosphodiesterase